MSARTVNGRVGGVLGVVGIGGAIAAVVATSTLLPDRSQTLTAARPLPVALGAADLACPGPETLTVPEGATPVDPRGPVRVAAVVAPGDGSDKPADARVRALGEHSDEAEENGGSAKVGGELELSAQSPAVAQHRAITLDTLGPVVMSAQRSTAPLMAAGQSTIARTGDLRGLAAVPCLEPASSGWLVGGGTRGGERLRLLLANPAATPAVADVQVHGPDGPRTSPAGDGITVPARSEVALLVDALAPGLERVAVHVTARSGRVQATLHDSRLRGLDPGGVDDVAPAADPARVQVIPGVSLVNGYGRTADDPDAPGSTSVRIAVPGAEEAVVRMHLVNSAGDVDLPRTAVVNVPAGGVVDVPVNGVPSGTYAAVVESDVPVVAGARIGRASGADASEFGWAAAVPPIRGEGYAVLPHGADVTVSLAAGLREDGEVRVTELHADGTAGPPATVLVAAGTAAAVRVSDQAVALRFDRPEGGPIAAALVSTIEDDAGPLISVPQVRVASAAAPRSEAVADRRLGLK